MVKRLFLLLSLVLCICILVYATSHSQQIAGAFGTVTTLIGLIVAIPEFKNWVVDAFKELFTRTNGLSRRTAFWKILTGFLAAVIVVLVVLRFLPIYPHTTDPPSPCLLPNGASTPAHLGVTATSTGQLIGVSDGRDFFDTQFANEKQKEEARQASRDNNYVKAESLWAAARHSATNDAESAIYQENTRVLNTGEAYIDIVLGVTFQSGRVGLARDILQGAYIAQLEFNQVHPLQIRLLIANSGNGYARQVTCQILQTAKADSHIIGLMGWSISQDTLDSIGLIDNAHFPMLAATASSDLLRNIPYFARVNPPDELQGQDGADYAKQQLQADSAVVFFDPKDPYNESLATAFEQRFQRDGGHVVIELNYTQNNPQSIQQALHEAQQYKPKLYYWAGYADDLSILLRTLPPCPSSPSACSPLIMGGSAAYIYRDYLPDAAVRANFASGRLYFTAFASPDEWVNNPNPSFTTFLSDYSDSYGPGPAGGSPYGYTRPDADTMLSFDAISVLTSSCISLQQKNKALTTENLHQIIVGGNEVFSGITGLISFGQSGNPINKVVLLLHVDSSGYTQIERRWGCLLKGMKEC